MNHHAEITFKKSIASLEKILASSYVLYTKTQNYHWNVTGPTFSMLHKLFEDQYTELSAAVDDLAERIRGLGAPAPGSLAFFLGKTGIQEEPEPHHDALRMLKALLSDHQTLITLLRKGIETAQAEGDEGTADLLVERLRSHEKTTWMLKSHLV
jgi:starvation-inducible DNA-binding protein